MTGSPTARVLQALVEHGPATWHELAEMLDDDMGQVQVWSGLYAAKVKGFVAHDGDRAVVTDAGLRWLALGGRLRVPCSCGRVLTVMDLVEDDGLCTKCRNTEVVSWRY